MIWGSIFQITGILFTATGSILALTKLWERYIDESKKRAEFFAWCYKEYEKADNELREHDLKYLSEIRKSDTIIPEYKEMIAKFTQSRIKQSEKTKDAMKKRIRMYYFIDRNLLNMGVWLIISGAILQIMGIIIG